MNLFKRKDPATGELILRCPRDGTAMRKIQKKNVILDVCPKCGGMWLDEGEIQKLQKLGRKK